MELTNDNKSARKRITMYLLVVNAAGFILSLYAHHVTVSKTSEANYQALCDISPSMSCSRVLTSKYSKGLGFMQNFVDESSFLNQSNSVFGMIFYPLLFLLSLSNHKIICKLHLILSVLSNIGSVYLACILIVLRDFCLVCVSTYVVNALNYVYIREKINLFDSRVTKTEKKE